MTAEDPQREIEDLRRRLGEAEQTLKAIRSGEVDSLVVEGPGGPRVYALEGAGSSYRVLVESMSEGAATIAEGGAILYCNSRFAHMLDAPLHQVMGSSIHECVSPSSRSTLDALLARALEGASKGELSLRTRAGREVSTYLSIAALVDGGRRLLCLVATDLSEQKRNEEIVASERLACSVLEQAAEAIVVCDVDGRIIRASAASEQLCGANPLLRPFREVFPLQLASPSLPGGDARTEGARVSSHITSPLGGEGWVRGAVVDAALGGLVLRAAPATLGRPDGSSVELLVSATALRGTGDRAIGCVVGLVDVTEQKRAEEALRDREERLAVTLRSIGDAVIATDEAGRVAIFNGVAEALTGWKAEEALGRPLPDVFHIVNEETRERADSPIDRVLREGVVLGLGNHTVLVARDGTERPVADSAAPIRDRSGHVTGAVLVFRDRTQERRAERALRESEQRVRRKLDSILSPDGTIEDLELRDIIDVAALQSMLEDFYELSRVPMSVVDSHGNVLAGVGWQDICTRFHQAHPDTRTFCFESNAGLSANAAPGEMRLQRCKNGMWDAAAPILVGGHHVGNAFTGQFFFEGETPDRDLFRAHAARYGFDEDAYLAALDAVPRLGRQSVAAGMALLGKLADMLSNLSYSNVKLARALAERQALTASLEEKKDELEESDRRKNEFLAVLSHELRNPLAPICNSLYVLDRAPPGSDKARQALEIIRRQSGHLARLVNDLLDVTRISRGKIELRRERVDLCELARWACDDHRSLFHERGLELRVESAAAAFVEADETRMAQVIGNLLQNAARFSEAGGVVTVSVGQGTAEAEIRVCDDGAGIAPDLLPRLFEPFVQGDNGLARSKGGLGLGLALVKGLVELHGGSVRATSDGAGHGAEFVVRLPLAPAVGRSPATAGQAGSARSIVVLVIEDNADTAQSMADVLDLSGHRVHVARDGRSGLAKARELKPEVILCDIGLPDIDGYEVARTLRADETLGTTRLIALSGYAQPEDRRRAKEAGFDLHVQKPAVLEALLMAIARTGADDAC